MCVTVRSRCVAVLLLATVSRRRWRRVGFLEKRGHGGHDGTTHVENKQIKSLMHQLPLAGLERRLNRARRWMTLDCASKTGAAGLAARSTRLVSV
ncbi:hypothetical protein IWZ03DRAFT_369030 [Phyllosticta citriasiana]|uniref:Secreted protein n=1 Tax=Phyllosticta citriasiana TaxID=595635 RepID=A0ABR1KVC6_9PEZI